MSTQAVAGGSTASVAARLVSRNLVALRRLPSALVPSLLFPLFTTVAFSSVFGAAIKQYFPHLPTMNWYASMNALQGAAFAGVFQAFGTIRDFETGVVDRFLVAPIHRRALLVGGVATAMVRAVFPFVVVLVIGRLGGMTVPGGPLGLLMLLIGSMGVASIGCAWAMGLAYRIKSMSAAPLMQIGVFVLVFLSESQVPLRGLSGWLHGIARVNPATNILRMARQGFLGEVTWHQTWPGLLAIAGMFTVTAAFAARGLRRLTP